MTAGRIVAVGRACRELVADAAASLLLRPGHTLGMISGITVGVASALAAIVIADTQQAQIDLRFDLQRSDHVVVKSDSPVPGGFPASGIARIAALEPVAEAGEFSIWHDEAPVARSTGTTPTTAPVVVADPGGVRATGTVVREGASTDLLALPTGGRIAWVGVDLARELGLSPFRGAQSGDAQVLVRGVPFSIAGIIGNDAGFGYANRAVVVSRRAAVEDIGGVGTNVRLIAHVRPGSAQVVAGYMIRAGDPYAQLSLSDATAPDGKRLVGDVGADLRLIGAALGGFIGLVGMIAVANTLMMSVHQRRRELGLRSAMGWSRSRIGLLVLTESAAAGVVAGLVGSAVGLGCAAGWCWSQGWTLVMAPALPVLVIAGGVVASLVGGAAPALRAASTSPLTAMRS